MDGLRAIAVLAVVLFHLFPAHVKGGFVGVDIFFVISGFLISGIILNGLQKGSFTYADFYERRIKRIFPALAVVLVVCTVLVWGIAYASEFEMFGKHLAAGAGFASNIVFWGESGYVDAAADAKPLLHLWSLGVEEQYYIVWPLALALIYRSKRPLAWIVAIGFVSFILNMALTRRAPSAAFYLPIGRFWELLLGSGLAYRGISLSKPVWRNLLSCAGITLILVSIFFVTSAGFPGWHALLPTIGTFLLIAAGGDTWFSKTVLSRRAAVLIGLISYPLYLWHWPLLSVARLVGWQSNTRRVALVLLSFVLAWLTYKLVELPLRFGRPSPLKPVLLAAAVGVLGIGGLAIYATDGSWARLSGRPFAADLADTSAPFHRPCSDPVQRIEPPLNLCRETIASAPAAAIFGDSHADSIFHGLAQADRNRNWLLIGNSSCPPVNGVSVKFRLDTTNLLQCEERSEAATRFLIDSPAIRTVVLGFFGGIRSRFRHGRRSSREPLRPCIGFHYFARIQRIR